VTDAERLDKLRAMLAASERMGEGYGARADAIRAEIARWEGQR
jgi:hypothetical protein